MIFDNKTKYSSILIFDREREFDLRQTVLKNYALTTAKTSIYSSVPGMHFGQKKKTSIQTEKPFGRPCQPGWLRLNRSPHR
jgi:hypothetical protein